MTSRFVKDGNFVTRTIAGETIIVPITSGAADLESIYFLNEAGASVWQLLDGLTSADQIIEAVAKEYDVSLEQAASDVSSFLAELEARGLISALEEAER